jgi:TorA maturation chaperone TorD
MKGPETHWSALLKEARWYRIFSLCFQPPRPSLRNELRDLFSETGSGKERLWTLIEQSGFEAEHHYVLGSGGPCSPCESAYLGRALGGTERIMADVAGFYRAFAFHAHPEITEPVDHIAVELSFLSFLALKEAYALYRADARSRTVCREARERFNHDHLLAWIPLFAEALRKGASGSFYEQAARLMVERLLARSTGEGAPGFHAVL